MHKLQQEKNFESKENHTLCFSKKYCIFVTIYIIYLLNYLSLIIQYDLKHVVNPVYNGTYPSQHLQEKLRLNKLEI